MFYFNNLRAKTFSLLLVGLFTVLFLAASNLSCRAFEASGSETEDVALRALRDMTKDGKLPPESMVLQIENRYGNTRTGALARLLRARIHFENNDLLGAAAILNSEIFRQKTSVGDYAQWLRGKALFQMARTGEAMEVFAELAREFPNSMRTREARLLWAQGALQPNVGKPGEVPEFLKPLNDKNDPDALLLTAKAFELSGQPKEATAFYRRVYFNGAGSEASKEAEAKLTTLGENLTPRSAEEITARAERLYRTGKYSEALEAYNSLADGFPVPAAVELKRLHTAARLRRMADAQAAFNRIPLNALEKPEAFYRLALGFANARAFADARNTLTEMRQKFPASPWTPKALVDVGMEARDQKNRAEESYFLKTAVDVYPNAVEVADAQFELAWLEHEKKDFQTSARMLTEHLARYVDEDTSNRGKAGYWAARDSERIGKIRESCVLYGAVSYRYGANWYGYLADQRLENLRRNGNCRTDGDFPAGSLIARAAENLKVVTVAPETATNRELARAENADDLSIIGLFDWAIEELKEAKKTADNSPKINLALARYYRLRGDNVNALLALKPSYPDYSQMFPEEMGREEWDIFYPLTHWNEIKLWGEKRRLDPFLIAGFIRQETIFDPRARSSANAYGLMQLLVPTARSMARKYGADAGSISGSTLYNASLNIELGTAYMRDQFDKYGRVEYVAVAYNAGPGRVVSWRRTLPFEMDEFVEEIPFRETRGYVQGIIRNSSQYRRLYDLDGNFKPNVGTTPVRGQIDALPREQFAREFPEILVGNGKNAE